MKRFLNGSIVVVVVALLVLLLVSVVAAADEAEEAEPSGTAVRINFELAPGQAAKRGHYSVQLPGGAEVASWYAEDGWLDSGWIDDLEIKSETELVQVLYYPGPDTTPTVMRILNPAPGTEMGWLGKGMAHALEVAWLDVPLEGEAVE
jgi:hypothetical protein